MCNGRSYSAISQKFFWSVYDKIKDDFKEIYFATCVNGQPEHTKNNEYRVTRSDGRLAFLDFYIKDTNRVIEFDGDYWHGKRRGNQERDKTREERILKKYPQFKILHIKECDYKENPNREVKKCVNFLL